MDVHISNIKTNKLNAGSHCIAGAVDTRDLIVLIGESLSKNYCSKTNAA